MITGLFHYTSTKAFPDPSRSSSILTCLIVLASCCCLIQEVDSRVSSDDLARWRCATHQLLRPASSGIDTVVFSSSLNLANSHAISLNFYSQSSLWQNDEAVRSILFRCVWYSSWVGPTVLKVPRVWHVFLVIRIQSRINIATRTMMVWSSSIKSDYFTIFSSISLMILSMRLRTPTETCPRNNIHQIKLQTRSLALLHPH